MTVEYAQPHAPEWVRPADAPAPTHLHFIVYCAHMKREGTFLDNTIVDVMADNEADALTRARHLAPDRAHYFVHSIVEHHPHTDQQAGEA